MLLHCAFAVLLGSASRHTVFMPHVAARFHWDQWPRRVIQRSDILKSVGAKSLLNVKKFQMRVGSTTTGLMDCPWKNESCQCSSRPELQIE